MSICTLFSKCTALCPPGVLRTSTEQPANCHFTFRYYLLERLFPKVQKRCELWTD